MLLRCFSIVCLSVGLTAGCGGDDELLSSDVDHLLGDGTWASRASLPSARTNHTASLVGDTIYVAGGLEADGDTVTATARVDAYDPVADTWTEAGELQQARDSHQALVLDSERILFYGSYFGGLSHEVYDVTTGISTPTTGGPALFSPALGVLPGGSVLLVGGRLDPDVALVTPQIWVLDTNQLTWRQIEPLEEPLDNVALGNLDDGRVALIGKERTVAPDAEIRAMLLDPQDEFWAPARPANTIETLAQGVPLADCRMMVLGFDADGEPRVEILNSAGGVDTELWADVTPDGAVNFFPSEADTSNTYLALTSNIVARIAGGPAVDGAPQLEVTRFSPTIGEVITFGNGPASHAGAAFAADSENGLFVLGGSVAYVETRER